jgi:hypothetical protein
VGISESIKLAIFYPRSHTKKTRRKAGRGKKGKGDTGCFISSSLFLLFFVFLRVASWIRIVPGTAALPATMHT